MAGDSVPNNARLAGFVRSESDIVGSNHSAAAVVPRGPVIRLDETVLSLQVVFGTEGSRGEQEEATTSSAAADCPATPSTAVYV